MADEKKISFLDNVKSFGLGQLVPTMESYQKEIIQHVQALGGVGEINLQIKYKRDGEHQVIVTPVLKYKIPNRGFMPAAMFVTDEGELSENDPRQMNFDDVEKVDRKVSDVLGGKEFLLIENDNKTGIFNISGKNVKIISQFMKSREGKSWFRTQTAGLDRHQRNRLKERILKPKTNIQLWAGWIYKIIEEIKKDSGSS